MGTPAAKASINVYDKPSLTDGRQNMSKAGKYCWALFFVQLI